MKKKPNEQANGRSLRQLAELWWVCGSIHIRGKWSESWICRASGETADTSEQLWKKVMPRAAELYLGKTWKQFKAAMIPQSDNWPHNPWPEFAWGFLSNGQSSATPDQR